MYSSFYSSRNHNLNTNFNGLAQPITFALILALHVFVFRVIINFKTEQSAQKDQDIFELKLIPSSLKEHSLIIIENQFTETHVLNKIIFSDPTINIASFEIPTISHDKPYEINGGNWGDTRSTTIFDSKIREKLKNIYDGKAASNKEKLNTIAHSDGTQLVELGNHKCMKSLPNMSSGNRAINWSIPFDCGKSESEQMMDNVNADLRNRKMK